MNKEAIFRICFTRLLRSLSHEYLCTLFLTTKLVNAHLILSDKSEVLLRAWFFQKSQQWQEKNPKYNKLLPALITMPFSSQRRFLVDAVLVSKEWFAQNCHLWYLAPNYGLKICQGMNRSVSFWECSFMFLLYVLWDMPVVLQILSFLPLTSSFGFRIIYRKMKCNYILY